MTYVEAAAWLRGQDAFLILTHKRPDGDTLGCAAGLCAALRALGKAAYVLPNDGVTATYEPYMAPYWAAPDYVPERVVTVDIAVSGLLPANALPFVDRVDLALDHHPSHEPFAARCCVDAGRAACGELIYDLCMELGVMNEAVALPLYVAVATDTGCFVYANTTPGTHRTAAALMEQGSFAAQVNKRCFRTKSRRRLQLESAVIQTMEFLEDGAMVIATVPLALLAELNATEGDGEDLSALGGQIEGVRVSITLREQPNDCCKLSLRTDHTLNATQVCALLGGGGHAMASGATIPGSLPQARAAVLSAIAQVRALAPHAGASN